MALVVPREAQIASLPRRFAAALVDSVSFLVAVGAGGGAVFVVSDRLGDRPTWFEVGAAKPISRRCKPRVGAASTGLMPAGRNWRSPGMRLLGLRRVDARTGGPVSLRSATLLGLTATAFEQIGRALNRPLQERDEAGAAAEEEIARIRAARRQTPAERLAGTVVVRER